MLGEEEKNDNDAVEYWPMVQQTKVAKKLPALFDHVFCGLRSTDESMGCYRLLTNHHGRGSWLARQDT